MFTKRERCTLCETFEASPNEKAVNESEGPLICSYPASVVELPNGVFDDEDFRLELANFLSSAGVIDSDPPLPPPMHPEYVSALLGGVLRSVGHTDSTAPLCGVSRSGCTNVPRITKRVRDEVSRNRPGDIPGVWRRSSLWLLVRVAIQMSVDGPSGRASYKRFMLFFACTLARDESNTTLPSDLLHLMSSTILRRLSKLGTSVPDWLSEIAMDTFTCLQEVLDARWKELSNRPFLFQNPSSDELIRDRCISLPNSGEYIRNVLENPVRESRYTPFYPSHGYRGTLKDFLSSDGTFFDQAHAVDPDVTLYDVERAVEHDIDEWLARVTNVEEACFQLGTLMGRHVATARKKEGAPEDASDKFLTELELYVAIDKLVVKEIPMLADYSPEIPIAFLERLLLRKTTSLHRLSCAYRYLSARHSQSCPGWSVLSSEFTEDSFPVRYYDQSPHLQDLKTWIEEDAAQGDTEHSGTQGENAEVSPLPTKLLYAKAVVFELHCPMYIRIWRSAAACILHCFHSGIFDRLGAEKEHYLLACLPELQPYRSECQGPYFPVEIHFACFYPVGSQSRNDPILRYAVHHPTQHHVGHRLSIWQPNIGYELNDRQLPLHFCYLPEPNGPQSICTRHLQIYMNSASHTSNDVLAAQSDCPADLSLDEFIAFAHLRSGGSLQWLSILQGLRSRTLNLHYHLVLYVLAHATFQVGPLDLSTGTWIWHQELEDPSFCNALLDELETLFVEVGAGSVDGVLMNSISLLLTRVLASSPGQCVSERAIVILRSVRKKTFNWVQDILYDLTQAPTNYERRILLKELATACRSTFGVDPATFCKHFRSAEDADALLSCALLMRIFFVDCNYSILLDQDRHLSLAIEEVLKDIILSDPSDYGIDLAVGKVFACYRPGARWWEHLQDPNTRWLMCSTADQPLRTVHINLLDGTLRVDGLLLGNFLRESLGWWNHQLREILDLVRMLCTLINLCS